MSCVRSGGLDLFVYVRDLLLLRLLRSNQLNGWQMKDRLAAPSQGVLAVTAGSLYPALHRLETRGLVASEWRRLVGNRRAKVYRLTAAGQEKLEREWEHGASFVAAVATILDEPARESGHLAS